MPRRHGWAYLLFDRLQYDHRTQIEFHRWAIVFWTLNIPAATVLLFVVPAVWNRFSVFYVLLLSLYANADTDYDAMSAAEAALHAQQAVLNTSKEPPSP
jgi:hypothetical protein